MDEEGIKFKDFGIKKGSKTLFKLQPTWDEG